MRSLCSGFFFTTIHRNSYIIFSIKPRFGEKCVRKEFKGDKFWKVLVTSLEDIGGEKL